MAYTLRVKALKRIDSGAWEELTDRTFSGLTENRIHQVVVNNETLVLWDSSAEGALADFDVLILYSDQPVMIECTCNDGNAAEATSTFALAANCPVVLGADDGYYNPGDLSGTLDVIDRIRALELNSVDATVTLELHT